MLNVENELRANISSVKETMNSVNTSMNIFTSFKKFRFISSGHETTDKEIGTSCGQIICHARDITTSGGKNTPRCSVSNHDNEINDTISLQPGRDERRCLDLVIGFNNDSQ